MKLYGERVITIASSCIVKHVSTSACHVITTLVFFDPKLTNCTYLCSNHIFYILNYLCVILFVYSVHFELQTALTNMKLNFTVQTVTNFAHWTIELVTILHKCVATTSSRTPTHIVRRIYDSTHTHSLITIPLVLIHQTIQIIVT